MAPHVSHGANYQRDFLKSPTQGEQRTRTRSRGKKNCSLRRPPARPPAAGDHRSSTPAIPPTHLLRDLHTQRRASGRLVLRSAARGPIPHATPEDAYGGEEVCRRWRRLQGRRRRLQASPHGGAAATTPGGDRRRSAMAEGGDPKRSAMATQRRPQAAPWRCAGDPKRHGGDPRQSVMAA
ncbi:uncharacterized protein [Triticum aestivum]|uniref:uncharacterized protein n=1 Tax=Triticum aestivum TaxID=4565 RepID=UPI001D00D02E|nr:uncharacterized protein LOC123083420 [Triticum aestivum]XP_044361407.1 uncharacterized protein LOC123083420 [Triticum aestivum]